MGVDNNGILFLGLPSSDELLGKLEGFDMEEAAESVREAVWNWVIDYGRIEVHAGLCAHRKNGWDNDLLLGFTLADSGSYGCEEVLGLGEAIIEKAQKFRTIFSANSKIYIMNYQW